MLCYFSGAGLAFNSMYTVLREDEEVLDVFWIEMACSFVQGLSITGLQGGEEETAVQLSASLRHFGRVLAQKSALFNKVSF